MNIVSQKAGKDLRGKTAEDSSLVPGRFPFFCNQNIHHFEAGSKIENFNVWINHHHITF